MAMGRAPQPEYEAVLDAAADCYVRFGVHKTTAADIAARAGVSRATLYRRYGSHETILLAVLTRESEAMASDAEGHLAGIDDPVERVVEGMVFAVDQIARRPVHAAVFGSEAAGWAATQAIELDALRHLGEAGLRPLLGPAPEPGSAAEVRTRDLVDWMLRILISYAVVPGRGEVDRDGMRRQLRTCFVPALDQVLSPQS